MADKIVYINSDARFDFTAQLVDPVTRKVVAASLPVGTKLWSGVKPATPSQDPPLVTKRNQIAGGDEQQERVIDPVNGLFSAYLQNADTAQLQDGRTYQIDGWVELVDGTKWCAGILTFTAKWAVWRNPT